MFKRKLVVLTLTSLFMLAGCNSNNPEPISTVQGEKGDKGDKGDKGETGEKGEKGDTGDAGKDGVGIAQVLKTASVDNVDTYTIFYTDGSTTTFTVTNGTNGTDGKDGSDGVDGKNGTDGVNGQDGHTPVISINTDGYWCVDGQSTGVLAKGEKGDKGETGDTGEQGLKGDTGEKGQDGKDGIGIDSVTYTYDADGNTIVTIRYTDGNTSDVVVKKGDKGDKGEDGRSVVSIEKTKTEGNVDTYTITYSDGTESTFIVTNGKDGENGAKGIDGQKGDDGHTPVVTIGSNGNWYVDGEDTGLPSRGEKGDTGDKGDQGIQGEKGEKGDTGEKGQDGKDGEDGRSINSISKVSSDGLVDTYRITYSDGTTYDFTVTNGKDGEKGEQGIQGEAGKDGHTPVVTIGSNGNWYVDGKDTGLPSRGEKGDTGEKGDKGDPGEKGETGAAGKDGQSLLTGNGVPSNDSGNDGDSYIDVDSWNYYVKENGTWAAKGNIKKGVTGKSAYELYCEQHPDYTGTLAEWLEALANLDLADNITITLDTNGGNTLDPIVTRPNSYIEPEEPTRSGYVFIGWYLNGSAIDVNTYVFRTSCTIVAHYRSAEINVKFDANGGNIAYNTTTIQYGVDYSLPEPTKAHQVFDGWYYGTRKIASTGKWTLIKEDCTLTAKWNKKELTVTLSVDSALGTIDTTTKTLTAGDSYTLPVPTASTEAIFQGWYFGETQMTDAKGNSLAPLDTDEDVTFTAKFYTEITNIYQVLAMTSAQSTTGNYKVVNDLDFDGVDISPIENFSGVFDGGGHKFSNITLVKGSGEYGGLFASTSAASTIKNIAFDSLDFDGDWTYGAGLLGKANNAITIFDISFKDSFDFSSGNGTAFGGLIGRIRGDEVSSTSYSDNSYASKPGDFNVSVSDISYTNSFNGVTGTWTNFSGVLGTMEYDSYFYYISNDYDDDKFSSLKRGIVNTSNISFSNSFKSTIQNSSYLLGTMIRKASGFWYSHDYLGTTAANTYYASTTFLSSDGVSIDGSSETAMNSGLIGNVLKVSETGLTKSFEEKSYSSEVVDITARSSQNTPMILISHLKNNISGFTAMIAQESSIGDDCRIDVEKSENHGNTGSAWGGVYNLTDCINTGTNSSWDAVNTTRCIDTSNEYNAFSYGTTVTSSICLLADSSGIYHYWSGSGNEATVSKSSLLTKDFFTSLLKFDDTVWNFDDLNVVSRKYPSIRM